MREKLNKLRSIYKDTENKLGSSLSFDQLKLDQTGLVS